jgi:uncharacterized OB-fold protein
MMKTGLLAFRCESCQTLTYPARKDCGTCGNTMHAEPLPGNGRLVTWTVVHQSTPAFTTPYVLAWAACDGVDLGVLGRFRTAPGEWLDLLHAGERLSMWEERDEAQRTSVWMEVKND